MIRRLLSLSKAPKSVTQISEAGTGKKQTTTEKGEAFEKKVAAWLKRQVKATEVKHGRETLFKGKQAVRPFQIDVVVRGADDTIYWAECKDRKPTIKRTDINKFVHSAADVKATVGIAWKKPLKAWDFLLFFSTSPFDVDAINVAKQHGVGCYEYDGMKYHEKNKPKAV